MSCKYFALVSFIGLLISEEVFELNTQDSIIEWHGHKLTGSHNGTVSFQSGRLVLDSNGNLKSGEFTADLGSIVVKDIQDKRLNEKLTNHLKDSDFFEVVKWPTAKLVITKTQKIADNEYNIQGDMQIKGISHPVQFTAKLDQNNQVVQATAGLKLDRTRWDIRYNSGRFFANLGDKLIYDEFDLKVKVVASKSNKS